LQRLDLPRLKSAPGKIDVLALDVIRGYKKIVLRRARKTPALEPSSPALLALHKQAEWRKKFALGRLRGIAAANFQTAWPARGWDSTRPDSPQ
jgi:hypothetical protein